MHSTLYLNQMINLIKKTWREVQVNVVTTRELNMVYGESNEINGNKIVLSFTAEKKIVCFW